MTKNYNYIKYTKEKTVLELVLNRPDKANALNLQLIRELRDCIQSIEKDNTLRLVVLRGDGKNFCAGADLAWMAKAANLNHEENYKESLELADLFSGIFNSSKIFIAIVQGACYGGGVGLAAVCDFIIAEESAVFSLSEIRLGLVAATISPYIIHRIGAHRAKTLILTGERKLAREMEKYGFLEFISDAEGVNKRLDDLIRLIMLGGANAQQIIKELLNSGIQHLEENFLREKTATVLAESRVSDEGKEGIRAFLEKRDPKWRE